VIKELRDFFKSNILECDPSLKEWKDAFNIDNIPESIIDNAFHIAIDDINTVEGDCSVTDQVGVAVTLFKKGFRETQDAHDALLDKAIAIRLSSLNVSKYNQTFIRNVESVTTTATDIESNDNLIIVTTNYVAYLTLNIS